MTTANAHGNIPQIVLRHRLRIAREEAGLSVQGLAERMGVARNTVGNAEAGKGTPRKVVLNAWALATGVDIDWLQTGETPAGNDPDGGLNAGGTNSSVPNANSGNWYISRPQLRAVA